MKRTEFRVQSPKYSTGDFIRLQIWLRKPYVDYLSAKAEEKDIMQDAMIERALALYQLYEDGGLVRVESDKKKLYDEHAEEFLVK